MQQAVYPWLLEHSWVTIWLYNAGHIMFSSYTYPTYTYTMRVHTYLAAVLFL